MRLAHLITGDSTSGCKAHHRLYEDAIREIAEWLEIPENNGELIRIYINVSLAIFFFFFSWFLFVDVSDLSYGYLQLTH